MEGETRKNSWGIDVFMNIKTSGITDKNRKLRKFIFLNDKAKIARGNITLMLGSEIHERVRKKTSINPTAALATSMNDLGGLR